MARATEQWVYGWHAVVALLTEKPYLVRACYAQQGLVKEKSAILAQLTAQTGVALTYTSVKALTTKAQSTQHQGVCCAVKPIAYHDDTALDTLLADLQHAALILVLSHTQDPHNVGACLRTAYAAGADCVIMTRHKTASMTAVVHKAACGASFCLPIVLVTNLKRALNQLKQRGVWILATLPQAEKTIYEYDLCSPTALVMGHEGRGLSAHTVKCCDETVRIPQPGAIASLNISVATGISLFEAVRQRTGITPC